MIGQHTMQNGAGIGRRTFQANIILRYSQEGDLVLDQFAGGGTTLVEAKLLNRDIIGVDVNDAALDRCREKTDFLIMSLQKVRYI